MPTTTSELKSYLADITQPGKLDKYNQIQIIIPVADMNTIPDIILRIKTYIAEPTQLSISTVVQKIDSNTGIIKSYKKQLYTGANIENFQSHASNGKSNLFGWSPDEDDRVLINYASQPNIPKYKLDINTVHEIKNAESSAAICYLTCTYTAIDTCVQITHENCITETYIEYELAITNYCKVYIRVFQPESETGQCRIVCVIVCQIEEESHVIPAKLGLLHKLFAIININTNTKL
jgi:hypothetical protein